MLMNTAPVLSEELLAKIKGIQIAARHLVSDVFAGHYESAFKGKGMAFEEVREYQPGDEVRTIDWNVTARQNRPFVKLYRDERELTVIFMVDISASSYFGTVKKFKNEIAAEIAALLAYTALRNNDKVGLIVFSNVVEHYLPPKKGKAHIWRVIREILTYRSKSKETNFNAPLDFLNRVLNRRAVAFLISDFQGKGFEMKLRSAAKHHDLVAMSITDPKELSLPNVGFIELEDAETGEYVLVDTRQKKIIADFSKEAQKEVAARKSFFRSAAIDYIDINTSESYVEPIVKFFRMRERR
jgi:uncharacterized protein (DUF58 family)